MALDPNVTNAQSLSGLLVEARQDAIFAGYESSLYLPGALVKIYNVPAGSVTAKIPVFSAIDHNDVSTEGKGGTISELDITNVTSSGITVDATTYAVRTLLKDLGGLDAANVGTVLGRAVAEKFDRAMTSKFSAVTNTVGYNGSTAQCDKMTTDLFAEAMATIRENKFSGQLNAILHPRQVQALLADLSTADFAGSDIQNAALRSGFVGSLFGVNVFSSAYMPNTEGQFDYNTGVMFAEDAFGIAMFRGIEIEAARNAAGLGTDLVASLHAAPVTVDENRAVKILSERVVTPAA